MAKKKFYAVRQGRKTGMFLTWDECKKQVMGYPGAIYKSFGTEAEAKEYLGISGCDKCEQGAGENESGVEKTVTTGSVQMEKTNSDAVEIYVDGSYHVGTKEFSYGMVVLIDGKEKKFSQKMTDPELAQMRNVAGEIMGARAAMEYAIANNKKRLVIYHDYEGIAKWPLGIWKTNKEGTIAYKAYYDEAKEKVSVRFQKVTGHSGDKYNDYADKLAKQALGLE